MLGVLVSKFRGLATRQMTITYKPGSYVREFEGWRGIGIVFVMLAHYFPSLFIGSWIFMEMFFVMSGFLITGILMDAKSKPHYYTKFMGRRIVRVFPVYYFFLAIMFFVIPASWLDLSYYRDHQSWFWLYGQNWLYAIEGWPAVKGMHHLWSLAIEEQFYIVWPLVVLVFSSKGLVRFCIFLFFFSLIFRNTGMNMGFVMPFPYVATLGRMEGLVLGAIIAVLIRTDKSILEKLAFPVTIISGTLAVLMAFVAGTMMFQHPVHYMVNYTLVDIFFAGMITMTLCDNQLKYFRKLLNHPLFVWLGVLSYSLYIFHYPIQNIVEYNFQESLQVATGSVIAAKLLSVGIAVVITFVVTYIVHKLIELPFWKLRKYI
ncbi:MAG TPA: acyltransferase [Chitinophagaceae bacterium]|nr:acyltransferase [Chitinophagaceae bacterium]